MLRFVWMMTLATIVLGAVWAQVYPVDQPIMRKEELDFEDESVHDVVIRNENYVKSFNSSQDKHNKKKGADISFMSAFVSALSMIVVTELGDKTFFIAAIMAMNHPRITVFSGAMFALVVMHVISALFGYVITWIPRVYTFYASSVLFAIFGLKMLVDAWKMKPNEGKEELEEVQSDIRRREEDHRDEPVEEPSVVYTPDAVESNEIRLQWDSAEESGDGTRRSGHTLVEGGTGTRRIGRSSEEGGIGTRRFGRSSEEVGTGTRQGEGSSEEDGSEALRSGRKERTYALHSRIFLQTFTMTFLAEWGDRSQIGTVVMAARENVYGVIVGGLLGHFLCTGLAVVGGRLIAAKISVRTVTVFGGIVFLIFAVSALIMGP